MNASALPPSVARQPLVVSYDVEEAGNNIAELAREMDADGGNRGNLIRRIKQEVQWLFELLVELEDAR